MKLCGGCMDYVSGTNVYCENCRRVKRILAGISEPHPDLGEAIRKRCCHVGNEITPVPEATLRKVALWRQQTEAERRALRADAEVRAAQLFIARRIAGTW